MNKVFLVDGSSVLFRSYHGIRELRRSDGMATNAAYGYILTIKNLLKDYSVTDMVVAFDRKEKTFREEQYENYKANRVAPPDELITQIPYIKKITELMGIPQIELAGYEADDLIGTMAQWLKQCGRESVVVTSDKDMLQLVCDSICVLRLNPNQNKIYCPQDVEERYGVKPERLVDVFALMGDSIDNIPGVPGIGEKTAISLIQEFGTLENLYQNLDKFKGKKLENLRDNKDLAFLSRELATIHLRVPVELSDGFFSLCEPQSTALCGLYDELEFRSFAAELRTREPEASISLEERRYETVDTIEALEAVLQMVKQKGFCAVDTETDRLDPICARMVGFSISIEENQGWYVPVGHAQGPNIPWKEAKPLVQEVLGSEDVKKTGHHIKYDYHIFLNEGIQLRGIADDTLIASNLVLYNAQSHKLDDLAHSQLKMPMTPITDLIGTGKNRISMAQVDVARVSDYACEDTDATLRLHHRLAPQIQGAKFEPLYREVELPLLEVLAAMERKGITVDPDILEEQSKELGEEIERLSQEVYNSVGKQFNLNSPLQLAQILYDDLKILTGRKRSTRADLLEKLADEGSPIAQQILDYRQRQKIKSTYLDALRKLIDPITGRVHTTFNQSLATTGRISSNDPNLQNIPIRTDLGRRVRRAFVAAPGHILLSLDYSQIELRILAHISSDPGLLKAFAANEDIHSRTAADIFGVALNQVTSDMRRKAKEINFGLNYGMSPYGLAKRLGISDSEASQYINAYFSRYPRVQHYMDETVAFAQTQLYVETIKGRRIATPGITDRNRTLQDNARRAAINAPIQGSAADLLKVAMVRVHQNLPVDRAALLLTVHDELVLEVREGALQEIENLCRELMEQALPLQVPTPVECKVGANWADMK